MGEILVKVITGQKAISKQGVPMRITDNFHLSEFGQKARHGLPAIEYPAAWINDRLRPLCHRMEALRYHLGKPITIISGYRSEAYNRKIGGARHSQHVAGRAADIVVLGVEARKVHSLCLKLVAAGELRLGGLGEYPGFVHLDLRDSSRLVRWTGKRTSQQTEGG